MNFYLKFTLSIMLKLKTEFSGRGFLFYQIITHQMEENPQIIHKSASSSRDLFYNMKTIFRISKHS